jgi:hypothetical protein
MANQFNRNLQRYRDSQRQAIGGIYGEREFRHQGIHPCILPEFFIDGVYIDEDAPTTAHYASQTWPLTFSRHEESGVDGEKQVILVWQNPINRIASILVRLQDMIEGAPAIAALFNFPSFFLYTNEIRFNLLKADPDIANATWNSIYYGQSLGEGHGTFYDTAANYDDDLGGGEAGGYVFESIGGFFTGSLDTYPPPQPGSVSGGGSTGNHGVQYIFDGTSPANDALKEDGPYFGIHLFCERDSGAGSAPVSGDDSLAATVFEQRPAQVTAQTNRRRGFAMVEELYI